MPNCKNKRSAHLKGVYMRIAVPITLILILAIGLVLAGSCPCFAINSPDTGYELNGTQRIDLTAQYGVCKDASSGLHVFVPTKSSGEWNAFTNWAPGKVTLNPCATCSDGIQNQGETGVDCGGPCPACISCGDTICNGGENCSNCPADCGACPACTQNSDCDDSNPCTDDSCIGSVCNYTNNTASCDDGNEANCNDVCSNGSCAGSACPVCNNNATCDAGENCSNCPADCGACPACTQNSDCDDSNPCTDDSCIGSVCNYSNKNDFTVCGGSSPCQNECLSGVCETNAQIQCHACPICGNSCAGGELAQTGSTCSLAGNGNCTNLGGSQWTDTGNPLNCVCGNPQFRCWDGTMCERGSAGDGINCSHPCGDPDQYCWNGGDCQQGSADDSGFCTP